jgi:hypothetical protein
MRRRRVVCYECEKRRREALSEELTVAEWAAKDCGLTHEADKFFFQFTGLAAFSLNRRSEVSLRVLVLVAVLFVAALI